MINDVFAPVVKTLFIPDGNPGVQEVREIRAVPRLIKAEGDAEELTVSGEMDLSITYIPISEADDEVPWRTIEFSEKDDLGRFDNEEQVIARLESALKEDDEDDRDREEQWFRVDISVPFTLAIGTDRFSQDYIIRLDPFVHSSNWFVVGPNAIEFEAVLKLAAQAETENEKVAEVQNISPQREVLREEEIRISEAEEQPVKEEMANEEETRQHDLREEKTEVEEIKEEAKEEKPKEEETAKEVVQQKKPKEEETAKEEIQQIKTKEEVKKEKTKEQKAIEEAKKILQKLPPFKRSDDLPKINPLVAMKPITKQEVKPEAKPEEVRHSYLLGEKGYFQMKFYRVQLGEDLDAIADKFGISKERISAFNSVHEEEIRSGLLLSIPHN
ncbi:MAG: LysM peptidoglycan-binding domain-containing protein [Bacillota bacterium]|jgi:hypothetical protein